MVTEQVVIGPDENAVTRCSYINTANARLIAAAPELLEELKTAVAIYHHGTESPEEHAGFIEHWEKLIAKVEGSDE